MRHFERSRLKFECVTLRFLDFDELFNKLLLCKGEVGLYKEEEEGVRLINLPGNHC